MNNSDVKYFNMTLTKTKHSGISGWLLFILLLIILKGILLFMDHHPMFFFGDSSSYITSAILTIIPRGRSFVYGCFINSVAVTTHSLLSLVIVQTCLGGIASIVLAYILIRYFNVRHWLAFSVALLTCVEPMQLMYERYVMTETLALCVFTFYLCLILSYLEDPRVSRLMIIQGLATLLISIRFAFIPMAWVCSLAIPIFATKNIAKRAGVKGGKAVSQRLMHLILSFLALYVFTTTYKHLVGYMKHLPPAYSYESGFFSLIFILPMIEPNDFPDEAFGHKLLQDPRFPTSDRRQRDANRWSEGGVIDKLCKMEPDLLKANSLASQAVINAITRKPLAFIRLGWGNFTDYFETPYLKDRMISDVGNRKLNPQFQEMVSKHFNYPKDPSSGMDLKTFTGRYFLNSGSWFQCLLFLPLWVLFFVNFRDKVQRRNAVLICLISLCLISVAVYSGEGPEVRYLHTCAWIFILMAGVGINRLLNFFSIGNLEQA